MQSFDVKVASLVNSAGGTYQRYCDDIIVVADKYSLAEIDEQIAVLLKDLQLAINLKKTHRVDFDSYSSSSRELNYLGFTLKDGKIRICDKTLAKYRSVDEINEGFISYVLRCVEVMGSDFRHL